MRLRIILLTVATSSLVLVSFLLPLALVLRTLAADRAVSVRRTSASGSRKETSTSELVATVSKMMRSLIAGPHDGALSLTPTPRTVCR